MNIKEIEFKVKKLNIAKDEFYIEGYAALVIRKIIDSTDKIKICTTNVEFEKLKKKNIGIIKDEKHIIVDEIEIRNCSKNNFDMEKCQPYNLESISKILYIMLDSKDTNVLNKIKEYMSPSFLYVMNEKEYEIEKKKGANIEERDSRGETPIFRAVRNNNIDLVNKMIKDGANVNEVNVKGCNLAFFCNDLNLLKVLIDNGLDFEKKNCKGNTVFDYNENKQIVKFLKKCKKTVDITQKLC